MGVVGPSVVEVWRQLCDQVGGEFVKNFWKGGKVQVHHRQWTITLDIHVANQLMYTRMRTPFVSTDRFRFTIYRKSIFSGLGMLMGMQDIEIGEPGFDDDFIIKGNDELKLRALLANRNVRRLIEQQPKIYLAALDDEWWFKSALPEGVDELYFRVRGVVKDLDRLKSLFDLFAEVLDQLCRIGSADEVDPGTVL